MPQLTYKGEPTPDLDLRPGVMSSAAKGGRDVTVV